MVAVTDLFTNHLRFADVDGWHAEADALRAEGVIHRIDETAAGFPPFWAVLGLEEVLTETAREVIYSIIEQKLAPENEELTVQCSR